MTNDFRSYNVIYIVYDPTLLLGNAEGTQGSKYQRFLR